MLHAKLAVIFIFVIFAIAACFQSGPKRYVIADSKAYEASLFRQHCAVCHGPEGEGKTLDDGTKVPSLREGEFKFKTEGEIYNQISNGGNGMTPFRDQLTARELKIMTAFVHDDLRK
ncbi:MAG: cytochrome c [Acidobacteriota bacterium]